MIVVECYLDEFLVKSLGFFKRLIKHEGGKGEVLSKVRKNRIAIGIVDEDPHSNQPSEMQRYIERETSHTVKLLVRKDDDRKRIIQISPYLEHWLLHRARQNQILPKDFGLPDTPKTMHDVPHIERSRNFQNFLNKLIKVDDEANTLKKWIKEAIE